MNTRWQLGVVAAASAAVVLLLIAFPAKGLGQVPPPPWVARFTVCEQDAPNVPAVGVDVELLYRARPGAQPQLLGRAVTDAKGRAEIAVSLSSEQAGAGEFAARLTRGSAVRSWRLTDVPRTLHWQLQAPQAPREPLPVIENAIGLKLVQIPPGEFLMGSAEDEAGRDDDETQHRVVIDQPFWMGVYEVTQAEYERVMGGNPSYFSAARGGAQAVRGLDIGRFPVEWVSWDEALEFCRRLSALPDEQQAGRSYRLPTEAEWEHACRAGTTTPFHFGAQLNGREANCDGRQPYGTREAGPCLSRPTTVGSYPANAFGLYDMHGNVCEWCQDWYDKAYQPQSPDGMAESGTGPAGRTYRGGHWSDSGRNCRSANRYASVRGERASYLGFRVVAGPRSSASQLAADAQQDMKVVPAEPPSALAPKETLPDSGPGIYAWRTLPRSPEWLQTHGASARSEQAVADGLAWLARHQSPEGVWCDKCLAVRGSNPHACCEATGPCSGPGASVDMALTGLAVLAFQAGGHYAFNGQKYSGNVERGLRWIVDHRHREDGSLVGPGISWRQLLPAGLGDLVPPDALGMDAQGGVPADLGALLGGDAAGGSENRFHQYFMYEHGIATFALAEACAVARASNREPPPEYLEAATAAVRFIQRGQHDDGGWRYTTAKAEPSDTSVSGWQVLALKTAIEAGIQVERNCLDRVQAFFQRCEIGSDGKTGYMADHNQMTEATTGVGMLVHEFLRHEPNSPLVQAAAPYLARFAAGRWGGTKPEDVVSARNRIQRFSADPEEMMKNLDQLAQIAGGGQGIADYYLWYNCTLAMSQAGGEPWRQWNVAVRDLVTGLQEHDGCRRGSWSHEDDVYGTVGGRVYSTALAALTLQSYYRFVTK